MFRLNPITVLGKRIEELQFLGFDLCNVRIGLLNGLYVDLIDRRTKDFHSLVFLPFTMRGVDRKALTLDEGLDWFIKCGCPKESSAETHKHGMNVVFQKSYDAT